MATTAIDSLKFARERQTLRGSLPVSVLSRLRDSLVPGGDVGEVDYVVIGGTNQRAQPVLQLTIGGRLLLRCQRCLEALMHDLAIATTLRLVPQAELDAEHSDDPDEPDCIAASAELDLAALIEDEILLALPAYPRHDARHGGKGCGVAGGKVDSGKPSAFSVLDALKSKNH